MIYSAEETLKAYRRLSGYTISAVEGAIDDMKDSISKCSDPLVGDLLKVRLMELENDLKIVVSDD